jgi:hypothetical protein
MFESSDSTEAEAQPVLAVARTEPTSEDANGFSEPISRPIVDAVAETPESPESAIEYEPSVETEQEISDEILAQLTQGIEIEVSADSLAAFSASDAPAEESPAQFYSSDAEPERQSPPTTENAAEPRSSDSESTSEPEKSRKATAGE